MLINIEAHKVYVDSLKMEMVPYSIVLQALNEVNDIDTEKYTKELDSALAEFHKALKSIKVDN